MTFALNTWYVAMWADDLRANQLQSRTVCDQSIVLFRRPDGSVAALEDRCAHRFAPLSLGRVCDNGQRVECPYHGLQFNDAGTCVLNPHGSGRIPSSLAIQAFPVVERHTLLWVWLGPADSDPSLIPDFSHLDVGAPGVVSKRDFMEMPVDYQLMIDNLMDLSHASFLHRGVLGNAETIRADVSVEQEGETVTVTRLSFGVTPPELFDLMFRNDARPVDKWSIMRWDAPGCLRHDGGVCEPGGDRDSGVRIIGSHLVTPSTQGLCTYHFAAVRLGSASQEPDEEVAERMSKLRRFAFEEQDAPILEAQQRAYDRVGGYDPARNVALSIDAAPLRVRRVLNAKIVREQLERRPLTLGV
jgi:phenylpropionate dioxygenase-like ring-hydroxylating dioxygenase large terminal subunit